MNEIKHLSVAERAALGKAAHERTRPSDHSGWAPAGDRPDPVALLEEQNPTREADLVPVRHGRMMVSPFTFYRGAAKIMAADLKDTPTAGLNVQLCGDAAHAQSGDPITLAAYLGTKDKFDQSIADFSHRYADQNGQDYRAFCNTIRSGRLEAIEGV